MTFKAYVFDPSDIARLTEVINPTPAWQERAVIQSESQNSYVYTVMNEEDEVLCIFGGTLLQRRNMSAWSLLSPLVFKYPKTFHKFLRDFIDTHFRDLGLVRMQTTVDVDNERAQRQNEKLGFEKEALLKKFGPNEEDQYLYVRMA